MRNRHVSNTAPCLLCNCACPHDLHIIHMSTSRPHLSNMALLLQWRLIYYASTSRQVSSIQHGPSYYTGGLLTMRNHHVSNTAPCLLCSCACPHDLHIIHMSTSRPHLFNMALLLQWRLIYYAKSPCVQYSPMPFMQLRVFRTTSISYI